MLYLQDIEEIMDNPNITYKKITELTDVVASGEFLYTHPYQLKQFLSKYTKFIKKYYSLNETK